MIKIVDIIAFARDIVIPSAIRNSWIKLLLLPSSSMQNSEPLEETANSKFIKQFLKLQTMISKTR